VNRVAAFFDLDRTLMAGSSGMHFARAAYRSGMVSRARLARWGVEHVRFRLRGSTDARTAQVLSQVKELLAGVPERDIERMGPDLLAGVLPRIYPKMLEEVRAHQDAGRATFIVSAAGNGLVEMLARVLGMDGGIGTRYEVSADGMLTGRIVEPFVYGDGKVTAMKRFAEEHDIDLTASWAYSDSASDLPMLRAVGNPVAVNPDAELAKLAVDEGWRIMRFEKLGRRLAIGGATLAAAASGTLLATRRRHSPQRLRARSSRPRR
jgi:HAD superfamily hydrolase (TIGR01490 family)